MNNDDENNPESSARQHLTTNSRVQVFFRHLSKKFEDLADAAVGSDGEHLDDRIAALEQRLAVLEAQQILSMKHESG